MKHELGNVTTFRVAVIRCKVAMIRCKVAVNRRMVGNDTSQGGNQSDTEFQKRKKQAVGRL
jgi:hypothetical protein